MEKGYLGSIKVQTHRGFPKYQASLYWGNLSVTQWPNLLPQIMGQTDMKCPQLRGQWDGQHGLGTTLHKMLNLNELQGNNQISPDFKMLHIGGWGRRTAWTQEAEVAVSRDCAIALQPEWESKNLSQNTKHTLGDWGGGSPEVGNLRSAWPTWRNPISKKIKKKKKTNQKSKYYPFVTVANHFMKYSILLSSLNLCDVTFKK